MRGRTKKVLYISSGSIASNPRMVKSCLYLMQKGYDCTILCFQFGNWTDELSQKMIEEYNLDCIRIHRSRKKFFPWVAATLVHKTSMYISTFFKCTPLMAYASDRRSFQLELILSKLQFYPDLVLAHNIAALYPAYKYSGNKKIPFAFDVEDYHPGESKERNTEMIRREVLMRKCLPNAEFVTAASPLIGEEVEKLLKWPKGKVVTVNNSFYSSEFKEPAISSSNRKLKMVWFSQYIGFGRGLEFFIKCVEEYKEGIEITLIGIVNDDFYKEVVHNHSDFVSILPPIPQRELHNFLSKFDIGLALELSSANYNREICLTNKIFAYVQAGLYILATDTKAQKRFLIDNPIYGEIVKQIDGSLKVDIKKLLLKKGEIRKNRSIRKADAESLAYQHEGEKLATLVGKVKK